MYRERYLMVRQRVQRHELFRPPIIESSRRDYIKLSPLDSLVRKRKKKKKKKGGEKSLPVLHCVFCFFSLAERRMPKRHPKDCLWVRWLADCLAEGS